MTRTYEASSLILCKRLDLEYRDFRDRFIRRITGSATKKSHLARSDISWISLILRTRGGHYQGGAKKAEKCRKINNLPT